MRYDPEKLLLIAGPCALESESIVLQCAEMLAQFAATHPQVQAVFKGSFDKANRTSLQSPRGPGLEEGLRLLALAQERTGLPVTTDVHLPQQCAPVAEVCDCLQIPAFLCRQTDMLVAAARTGKPVNVKKGQFLSPAEMRFVVNKLQGADAVEIWQTERGTTFGYQNLVVDMRSFSILSGYAQPVIFDATHSVQLPGAGGGKTTGQREFVPALARAAIAAGASGLFLETHPNPDEAISDGPNQVPLDQFSAVVQPVLTLWQALQE